MLYSLLTKIKQGGKPVITLISSDPLQYKEGDDIDLYSLITISDNEDGNTTILKVQIVVVESITNMKNVGNGLIAFTGKLEYDNTVLELGKIIGENRWNFDKNSFNENSLKFVTESGQYVTTDGIAFRINMKVIETIDVNNAIETVFNLKDLQASNGENIILANDAKLTLHIEKKSEDPFTISSDIYEISDDMITYVLPNTIVTEFNKHITTNRTTHIMNKEGEEQTDDNLVATGMKLQLKKKTKNIRVLGDINGDGEMNIVELAKLKLHLIDIETLTGIELLVADVDKDVEVNIADLAVMKLVLIGLKELI